MMSPGYVDHFTVENVLMPTIPLLVLVLGFVQILFSGTIFDWARRSFNFSPRMYSFLQDQHGLLDNLKVQVGRENEDSELSYLTKTEKIDGDARLSSEDVEMVIKRLGIVWHRTEGGAKRVKVMSLSWDDVSNLFEEDEPSLDEVKEAFDVFDEDRDGFISSRELQRVLFALGLPGKSQLESCERMIAAFDENGDGRIDFNEFVKFMENSFC